LKQLVIIWMVSMSLSVCAEAHVANDGRAINAVNYVKESLKTASNTPGVFFTAPVTVKPGVQYTLIFSLNYSFSQETDSGTCISISSLKNDMMIKQVNTRCAFLLIDSLETMQYSNLDESIILYTKLYLYVDGAATERLLTSFFILFEKQPSILLKAFIKNQNKDTKDFLFSTFANEVGDRAIKEYLEGLVKKRSISRRQFKRTLRYLKESSLARML